MSEKSLYGLADEYTRSAAVVYEQIHSCRQAIAKAKQEHRSMLVNRLERNLGVLYTQHSELCGIAQHLREYYAEEVQPAV